ncbi:ABC transporter, putative [Bodo saltans]|uniref:ABC transporter, putative n=1 Tax=Bodo saltans TaxID=75058 RepID=A0A0S4IQH9_BODSA|nr:ABC transporter, putative [Bodo saltans]|eukprot:CUF95885.1 ABC transporter, putative [Bodo saltans]
MVTWTRCFAAALQKNALLRRSAYLATTLEILMPSLFMLLLSLGYWLTDNDSSPAASYTDSLVNLSAVVYDMNIFCSYYTDYSPPQLMNCDDIPYGQMPWNVNIECLVIGGDHWDINPSIWGSACITNRTIGEALIASLATISQSIVIPDFDAYLILQGLLSRIFHVNFPLEKGPKASMSHGGYLGIASSDSRVTAAFTTYCSNVQMSYYCSRILYSQVFESMSDARNFAYENGNMFWALLDLTQINYDALITGTPAPELGPSWSDATVYTISMNYTATPWTFQSTIPLMNGLGQQDYLQYLASGFLTLQQFTNNFIYDIAQNYSATSHLPPLQDSMFNTSFNFNHVAAAPMPTRAYFTSEFLVQSGHFVPLVMTFAFLYGLSRTLSGIVEEKEAKVREAMLIMGLPLSAFYSSWILTSMIINCIACIGSTIVLYSTLFNSVNPLIMFIVNYTFSLTVMAVAMLISVFFAKPRIAAIVGPLIMFVSTVPFYAIPEGTPQSYIVAASVLPCTAYAQAINAFISYAQNGYGVTWSNTFDGTYSIALSVFLMLVDTALYLALALYLDLVLPSEHGTQRHPLFFYHEVRDAFRRWRHKGSQDLRLTSTLLTSVSAEDREVTRASPLVGEKKNKNVSVLVDELHEAFSPSTRCIVSVQDLVKTYSGEGQSEPIRAVRGCRPSVKQLGYCPQHNIIWPILSVAQHLRVYARLKSESWDVEEQVTATLELVQLVDKRDAAAGSLSGGQKRKLCVGISLIGNAPFLLLDEPTAGMDLEARRAMWDMLLKIRRERCILLSTHFMDEADLLGDRIMIMSHGRMHSAGTPLFLKSKLGIGYSVTCVLDHEQHSDAVVAFMEEEYLKATRLDEQSTEGQALCLDDVTKRGKEVVVRFPMSFTSVAGTVFEALEREQSRLHIHAYGLSLTTMEDVFLSIALLGDADLAEHSDQSQLSMPHVAAAEKEPLTGSNEDEEAAEEARRKVHAGRRTFLRHFAAMFVKRFHCAKRDRRMVCFQIVMPIIFLCIALLVLLLHPPNQPAITLDGSHYGEMMEVFISPANTTAYWGTNNSGVTELLYPTDGPLSIVNMMASIPGYSTYYTPVFQDALCNNTAISSMCLSYIYAAEYNHHAINRYVGITPFTANVLDTFWPSPTSTVFHNASAPHALPEAMSLGANLALRRSTNLNWINVKVINDPLTLSKAQQVLIDAIRRIVSAIFILIPFTFVPANYVCYIVKEKECKAKHLQWVAGSSMLAFWLSSLVWDLLTFLFTEALCMAVFFIFKRDEFIGDAMTAAATFTLFFMYGLASIPFSYVVSFAFKNSSTAQNITMMGNFFSGFLLVMAAQILSVIETTKEINFWLCKFYRVVPAYALGEGIITLTGRGLASFVTGDAEKNPFDMLDFSHENGGFFGGVGTSLVYLGAAAPAFFIILMILEGSQYIRTRVSLGRVRPSPNRDELVDYGMEDEDVLAERLEAEATREEVVNEGTVVTRFGRLSDGMTARHLRKEYNKEKLAVKDLSFGVKTGETFALLGTNGAGKTTTISILTGEHIPTCGDALINGCSIVKDMHLARQWIGYCPQFDALHEHMTPREHLTLYCRLRGLTSTETAEQVDKTIHALSLGKYADTMAKALSGGNKRKLSLGIALIGDTKLILLDEPTAGMDPVARRDLWKSLALVAKRRSIVLTTHHLEEVEALADRVGIMVGGKMMGLGSLQHLKSKYVGDVFEVQVSFAPPRGQTTNTVQRSSGITQREGPGEEDGEERNAIDTIAAMQAALPPTAVLSVVERNGNKLTITVSGAPLSSVFRATEQRKRDLQRAFVAEEEVVNSGQQIHATDAVRRITEYALSQATLEQVFLRIGILARQNPDGEEGSPDEDQKSKEAAKVTAAAAPATTPLLQEQVGSRKSLTTYGAML